jgi:hypothetical protein
MLRNEQRLMLDCFTITTSFWTLQNSLQRFFGAVGLHGRMPLFLNLFFGITGTSFAITTSHIVKDKINKKISRNKSTIHFFEKYDSYKTKNELKKENIRSILFGLSLFIIIERNSFRTVFPSSSISLGVLSKLGSKFQRSIISTSIVATESQRKTIQSLGKKFGCHQCGSRQLFSGKQFIADHMPPTKFVQIENLKTWRKFFNLQVSNFILCLKKI